MGLQTPRHRLHQQQEHHRAGRAGGQGHGYVGDTGQGRGTTRDDCGRPGARVMEVLNMQAALARAGLPSALLARRPVCRDRSQGFFRREIARTLRWHVVAATRTAPALSCRRTGRQEPVRRPPCCAPRDEAGRAPVHPCVAAAALPADPGPCSASRPAPSTRPRRRRRSGRIHLPALARPARPTEARTRLPQAPRSASPPSSLHPPGRNRRRPHRRLRAPATDHNVTAIPPKMALSFQSCDAAAGCTCAR
jgi:hypothetical protein